MEHAGRALIKLAVAVLAVGGSHLQSRSEPSRTYTVLLEAESFANLGTWVVDQQFMDQMGSPYLLAHGLGVPVLDASTEVTFPATGTYRVFVRTRDWVAPWNAPGAPGRFQVKVNGVTLGAVFGTEGAKWHWQEGGTIQISKTTATVLLHDVTGFEGRCDALLFTTDPSLRPPDGGAALREFRRRLRGLPREAASAGSFDLVVVGGGIAGTCAAISAARLGISVALIQDRPVLGGNNSSEVRVWLGGATNFEPYPRVGDLVRELDPLTPECPAAGDRYGDEKKLALVRAEPKVSLFLNFHANEVETAGNRIRAVVAEHVLTGRRLRFRGKYFADTTGDGTVGYLAGAAWEMTERGHMGNTNLWRVEDTGEPAPFPRCPWALDLRGKPFPDSLRQLGTWFWESGFDLDPFQCGEYIRDLNFRAMYGAWDYLKNERKKFPTHAIVWAAYVTGKRESRRLLGDVVLSGEDLLSGRLYEDGCVPTSWRIDLHLPHEAYADKWGTDAFISRAHYTDYKRPYWVPYRCLYSRNVANLFMAGRDISVTHEALGCVRVQRTTGMMGEVVGMAASLCCRLGVDPRELYKKHLDKLKELLRRGVGAPSVQKERLQRAAGANVAGKAAVKVSGSLDPKKYPPRHINDGRAPVGRNAARFVSSRAVPSWIEFSWERPVRVTALRIVSGYLTGQGNIEAAVRSFVLQTYREGSWREVPGTAVKGNALYDRTVWFAPVSARRLRLLITQTPGDVSRIWEVELYEARPARQGGG